MGRLVSDRLTPRQFELLSGIRTSASPDNLSYVKDAENGAFLERRELIRLQQEMVESMRRKKVIAGEWKEEESHALLQQEIERLVSLEKSATELKNEHVMQREVISIFSEMQSPERLHEKEYHFDEGMGQSLQEHVKELRERTPGLKVLTRRDRDGFAIVKTEWTPEFKYSLDMDMDLDKANENRMKTMEVLA